MPRDDHASTNRSMMQELTALKERAKSVLEKIDAKRGEVRLRYREHLAASRERLREAAARLNVRRVGDLAGSQAA